MFEYKLTAQDAKTKARTGEFKTPHGTLNTPSLAIVGTEGQIKGIPPGVTHTLPLNYTIVNTFHIWTKNIIEKIVNSNVRHPELVSGSIQSNILNSDEKKQFMDPDFRQDDENQTTKSPTVHQYGGFPGIVASDSGGFQVFSLGFGKTHKVGKLFRHPGLDPGSIQIANDEISSNGNLMDPRPRLRRDEDDLQHRGNDINNPLKITEEGVVFRWNDEDRTLTPELSMELQHQIGADIMFAFDECTSPFNSKEYVSKSVELTDRWLARCVKAHNQTSDILSSLRRSGSHNQQITLMGCRNEFGMTNDAMTRLPQALFAIVQGSEWQDLRIKSAKLCAKHDVPGFGIGGSFGNSFGDSKKNMHQVLEWIMPHLPNEKPRHLLGIGQVDDIFEGVERGVDLFDCVIPTREARHKMLYTKRGRIAVKKIKTQKEPIAIDCKCIACSQKITGQQLYELFLQKDPRAFFYATVHNIQFFADLMEEIREAISANRFGELKAEYLRYY